MKYKVLTFLLAGHFFEQGQVADGSRKFWPQIFGLFSIEVAWPLSVLDFPKGKILFFKDEKQHCLYQTIYCRTNLNAITIYLPSILSREPSQIFQKHISLQKYFQFLHIFTIYVKNSPLIPQLLLTVFVTGQL